MAATAQDVLVLRDMIGTTSKTDDDLLALLDRLAAEDGSLDFNSSAAYIWNQKAAEYSELVDVSESGSSRKFSDLSKNALAMAAKYEKAAGALITEVDVSSRPKVNNIVRL